RGKPRGAKSAPRAPRPENCSPSSTTAYATEKSGRWLGTPREPPGRGIRVVVVMSDPRNGVVVLLIDPVCRSPPPARPASAGRRNDRQPGRRPAQLHISLENAPPQPRTPPTCLRLPGKSAPSRGGVKTVRRPR